MHCVCCVLPHFLRFLHCVGIALRAGGVHLLNLIRINLARAVYKMIFNGYFGNNKMV